VALVSRFRGKGGKRGLNLRALRRRAGLKLGAGDRGGGAPAILGGAFRRFRGRWEKVYPRLVQRLGTDLPELLSFYRFPKHLWRKLRTTNVIERCFVEVRRRTRPMVCFVNVESVDRIIYSIFHRFNLDWRSRTLRLFTQAA
jgi:transposase-like protein